MSKRKSEPRNAHATRKNIANDMGRSIWKRAGASERANQETTQPEKTSQTTRKSARKSSEIHPKSYQNRANVDRRAFGAFRDALGRPVTRQVGQLGPQIGRLERQVARLGRQLGPRGRQVDRRERAFVRKLARECCSIDFRLFSRRFGLIARKVRSGFRISFFQY